MGPIDSSRLSCDRISPEARLYALKELSRRAGVSPELFNSWKIELQHEQTVVYIDSSRRKKIKFRNRFQALRRNTPHFHTVRASWMCRPSRSLEKAIPDFIVPFSEQRQEHILPMFSFSGDDCLECPLDLLCSILMTLGRYEEIVSSQKDQHGRFPASASVAVRENFIQRPIVDEYGLALEQAISALLPRWHPQKRKLQVKITHDVDDIGMPLSFMASLGHWFKRRNPSATTRDFIAPITSLRPSYLEAVLRVVQLSFECGLNSAIYWKCSPFGHWDTGYDPSHPKVQKVISLLRDKGVEQGFHPGYSTFMAPEKLQQEANMMREILKQDTLGGRQHYLRWSPETWEHWERCNLRYDSTVGFTERIGFRAGTCIPYRPWLFQQNRAAALVEIPLIVMDCSLTRYMGLDQAQSLQNTLDCIDHCRTVGGVFALNWHNTSIMNPEYGDIYSEILNKVSGEQNYSMPTSDELTDPMPLQSSPQLSC